MTASLVLQAASFVLYAHVTTYPTLVASLTPLAVASTTLYTISGSAVTNVVRVCACADVRVRGSALADVTPSPLSHR